MWESITPADVAAAKQVWEQRRNEMVQRHQSDVRALEYDLVLIRTLETTAETFSQRFPKDGQVVPAPQVRLTAPPPATPNLSIIHNVQPDRTMLLAPAQGGAQPEPSEAETTAAVEEVLSIMREMHSGNGDEKPEGFGPNFPATPTQS